MKKKIAVGIDYGFKHIGIAASSPYTNFAIPRAKIARSPDEAKNVDRILQSVDSASEIDTFVVGLPLHLSGGESLISEIIRKFAKKLENITNKKVVLLDERLTSKQAQSLLRETNVKRKKRDEVVDILSATLILQSYLDYDREEITLC